MWRNCSFFREHTQKKSQVLISTWSMLVLKCSSLPDTYFVAYSFFDSHYLIINFALDNTKYLLPAAHTRLVVVIVSSAICLFKVIGVEAWKTRVNLNCNFRWRRAFIRESDNWWYSDAMRRTNSIDVGKHFPIKTSTMTSPAPMVAALNGEDWWPWFDGIYFLSLVFFHTHRRRQQLQVFHRL